MESIEKIKMFLKSQPKSVKLAFILFSMGLAVVFLIYTLRSTDTPEQKVSETPLKVKKPQFVRGIHLTPWIAGSKKAREKIRTLLSETELNTVVIAIKEYEGEVYIHGVPLATKHKLFVNAIPDLKEYLAQLKKEGIYTIARIVVFKDNSLPRKRTELAVKRTDGSLWTDHRRISWTDPYNKEVWEYNFSIATQAVALGFEEIQFDYIRYPSDGDTKQCRYSYTQHNSSSASKNLDNFLEEASKRIKPLGANVSIDIFGLTPSVKHDMGIGQKIVELTQWVDYVSPMVYPSHYAKGEYGFPEPNREPYKVVYKTITDANKRLGDLCIRLRPYLQDFSLGYKYGPREVRAQIQACEDAGIYEWLLWNPNCNYTRTALKSKNGKLQVIAQISQTQINNSSTTKKNGKNGQRKEKILPSTPTPTQNLLTESSIKGNSQADSTATEKEIESSSPTPTTTQSK